MTEQFRNILSSLPAGCARAEIQAEREEKTEVSVVDGRRGPSSVSDHTAYFVRAGSDRLGTAYTEQLDGAVLAAAAQNAAGLSGEPDLMNGPGPAPAQGAVSRAAVRELEDLARAADAAVRRLAGGISALSVSASERVRTLAAANTLGLDIERQAGLIELQLSLVTEKDGIPYLFSCESSSERMSDHLVRDIERHLAQWLPTRLPEVPIGSGTYPAVLSAQVMANILVTAWQLFSGPKVLEGSSALAGKAGEKIFAPCLDISDLEESPHAGYRFPFDCEGTAGSAVPLVEGGVLTGLLHTLSSALRTGARPAGNAGRKNLLSGTVHTAVVAVPKNLTVRPGNVSREDLLREMGYGLLIHESSDIFHSINIASGTFHIPCSALIVRNGRMEGLARGLTVSGNLPGLLRCAALVADDVYAQPIVMLRSYTVSSPSALVEKLSVTG